MEHILEIAIGTFTMRPYVFAFFAAFLVAGVPHVGWRSTLTFTGIGYLIAFSSEWLSINTGFPYGWYYYIDTTSSRELWVAGVPFFDSLSYIFLTYCSYSTALFILSPLKAWRWNLVTLETRGIRRSTSARKRASRATPRSPEPTSISVSSSSAGSSSRNWGGPNSARRCPSIPRSRSRSRCRIPRCRRPSRRRNRQTAPPQRPASASPSPPGRNRRPGRHRTVRS